MPLLADYFRVYVVLSCAIQTYVMAHFSIPVGMRAACRRLIDVVPTLIQHIDNML
jgi:hypothetical protein